MKRVVLNKQKASKDNNTITFIRDMQVDELMARLLDFERGIGIDRNNLDNEVIRLPQDIYDIHNIYLAIVDIKAQVADELEYLQADISNGYRELYEKEKTRTTENAIAKKVFLDPEYRAKSKELSRIKSCAAKAYNLKDVYNIKKDMLGNLIKLHGQMYFSDIDNRVGISTIKKSE